MRTLSGKHRRTLQGIFARPVRRNIAWRDVEALLIAAGAVMIEGSGSRVTFDMDGDSADFHRPHPQKETAIYVVKDLRGFLVRNGVLP